MLGDAEQLKAGYMLAEEENLIDEAEFFGSEELTVRIRYRSKPIPCTVKRLEDGRLLVRFLSEASAIAPGQSAVFYVGRRVVGGSFIASQRGIGMYIAEIIKHRYMRNSFPSTFHLGCCRRIGPARHFEVSHQPEGQGCHHVFAGTSGSVPF